jgi:type IV pilus assembly protein PilV
MLMALLRDHSPPAGQSGVTMLEVLVTILIVAIALLGLAGLQARLRAAEQESFQRAQALILLQDMVDRIRANRHESPQYVTGTPLGTGNALDVCAGLTDFKRDLCEWNNALLGASESSGGGSVGAMIGARGCITNTVATMPYEFVVAVAWQGLTPTSTPTVSTCGQGSYGANDAYRRVLATRVVFSCLQNASDGLTCASTTP